MSVVCVESVGWPEELAEAVPVTILVELDDVDTESVGLLEELVGAVPVTILVELDGVDTESVGLPEELIELVVWLAVDVVNKDAVEGFEGGGQLIRFRKEIKSEKLNTK